jgi:hypothetical protein
MRRTVHVERPSETRRGEAAVTEQLPNPLQTARTIGLLGDVHGDLDHLLTAMRTFWARGVNVVLQLGDFGFIWKGDNYEKALDKISRRLSGRNQTLFWIDGNHEDFDILYEKFPVDNDGLRRLRPNIIHLPRGYRTELAPYDDTTTPHVLGVLGGANSIDRSRRTEHADWWQLEQITEADLAALGSDHVDVLLGHEAPLNVRGLDDDAGADRTGWRPSELAYAAEGRRMFHQGFMAVRPQLHVGGHWHRWIDERVEYGEADARFRCRVVVLDMNGPRNISLAILDVGTLALQFFTRSDSWVNRLDDRDAGKWLVHTADAVHAFDLDARTVERRPGPGARRSSIDQPLPLLQLRRGHIGIQGLWVLNPEDEAIPYSKYESSVIERIERVTEL